MSFSIVINAIKSLCLLLFLSLSLTAYGQAISPAPSALSIKAPPIYLGLSATLEPHWSEDILKEIPTYTWVSSNTQVASINGKGELRALAMGKATIGLTAKFPSGRVEKASLDIEVRLPNLVIRSEQNYRLFVSTDRQYLAFIEYPLLGRIDPVTSLEWSSSLSAILKINASGKASAMAAGKTAIKAVAKYANHTLSAIFEQAVSPLPKITLVLDESNTDAVAIGDQGTLKANLNIADNYPWQLEWSSTESEIIEIQQVGTGNQRSLRAHKPGASKIKVKLISPALPIAGVTADMAVQAYEPNETYVRVTPASVRLTANQMSQALTFEAIGYQGDIQWMVTNPEYVIDDQGVISTTAKNPGSTLIFARFTNPNIKHRPGQALAIFAEVQDAVVEMSPSAIVDGPEYEYGAGADTVQVRMIVDPHQLTKSLPPIGGVLGAETVSVVVDAYHPVPGTHHVMVRGTMARLNDVYKNLSIHIGRNDMQQMRQFAAQAMQMETMPPTPVLPKLKCENEWELGVSYSFNQDIQFDVDIQDGRLTSFVADARAIVDASVAPEDIEIESSGSLSASVSCNLTLLKHAVLGIPIYGVATLVPQVHLSLSAGAEVSATAPLSGIIDFPNASITKSMGGRMEYDPVIGVITRYDEDNSAVDAQPRGYTPAQEIEFEASGKVGGRMGVDWAIIPGPFPVAPYSTGPFGWDIGRYLPKFPYIGGELNPPTWNDIAFATFMCPLVSLETGQEITFNPSALLPATHENYQPPHQHNLLELKIHPLTNIQPGGYVSKALKWLGADTELQINDLSPPLPVIDRHQHTVKVREATLSPGRIYLGSGNVPGFPKRAALNVELDPERLESLFSTTPLLPWARMSVMGKQQNSEAWQVLAEHINDSPEPPTQFQIDVPTPGIWQIRIAIYSDDEVFWSPLVAKPAVTEFFTLEAVPLPVLAYTPQVLNVSAALGQPYVANLSVSNPTPDFISVVPAVTNLDWSVTPNGIGLASGETEEMSLSGQCPANEEAVINGSLFLYKVNTTEQLARIPVKIQCTAFILTPDALSLRGELGATPSALLEATPTGNELIEFTIDTNDGYTPPLYAESLDNGHWEISTECEETGIFDRHLTVTGGSITKTVPVVVHCIEPSESTGDPHLKTLDGLKYDFQAQGEYVLTRLGDGSQFEVQVRQSPLRSRVSVNTAVAVRVSAQDKVSIYGDLLAANGHRLLINSEATQIAVGESLSLTGGTVRHTANGEYRIYGDDGSRVKIKVRGSHFKYVDIGVKPPQGSQGQLTGLLGNYDADPDNDLRRRDGSILPEENASTFYDCHVHSDCFAYGPNSWLIREVSESLFTYAQGESPQTYMPSQGTYFPAQPVSHSDIPANERPPLEARCRSRGVDELHLMDCVLDIWLSGDDVFIDSAVDVSISDEPAIPPPTEPNPISCKQKKQQDPDAQNGNYIIDPDGEVGVIPSYEVYCDMTHGGLTLLLAHGSILLADGSSVNVVPTTKQTDQDSCQTLGLNIFSPKSESEFLVARDYLKNINGNDYGQNMGPLGIYSHRGTCINQTNNCSDQPGRPSQMNSAHVGATHWKSITGSSWWASKLQNMTEPSGNYQAYGWLSFWYCANESCVLDISNADVDGDGTPDDIDGDGVITTQTVHRGDAVNYDDTPWGGYYSSYLCAHPHNHQIVVP